MGGNDLVKRILLQDFLGGMMAHFVLYRKGCGSEFTSNRIYYYVDAWHRKWLRPTRQFQLISPSLSSPAQRIQFSQMSQAATRLPHTHTHTHRQPLELFTRLLMGRRALSFLTSLSVCTCRQLCQLRGNKIIDINYTYIALEFKFLYEKSQ